MALAKMLRAGGEDRSVMAQHYDQEGLFGWLSDKRHCNLSENFNTTKRSVYQGINIKN